jgi:hypothetical protein
MQKIYRMGANRRCPCTDCVNRRAADLAGALRRKFAPVDTASSRPAPRGIRREPMPESRAEMIAGLRAVADFYENNPAVYYDGMTVFLNMFAAGRDAGKLLDTAAASPGNWLECGDEKNRAVGRDFGKRVRLQIFSSSARD